MTHLSGEIRSEGWEETPLEQHSDGRKLTRASVKRTFAGELKGESRTEYLMAYRADDTASFVGMERLTGELDGETGSVMLALKGVYDGAEATADWEVVEGSGDGVFQGATGSGKFSARQGSAGEYKLHIKTLKTDPPIMLI